MAVDREEMFGQLLANAKQHKSHMHLGWALLEAAESPELASALERLKRDAEYPELVAKALDRFRQIVQDTGRTVERYGFGADYQYEDEDFYKENKKILSLLECEAKRLGPSR